MVKNITYNFQQTAWMITLSNGDVHVITREELALHSHGVPAERAIKYYADEKFRGVK